MKTFIKILLLIVPLLFLSVTIAGNRHHNIPDIKYIEYGKKFECIKQIVIQSKDKSKAYGSCVFISPNVALTSAHIITEDTIIYIVDEKKSIEVDSVIVHKNFNEKFGQADIAILKLSKNNPFEISAYPELYKKRDEIGKLAAIGGYGITGTGIKGYNISDSKLRCGTNIIDQVIENLLCCKFSKDNPSTMEFIITPGDSGGGLFIDSKLAGINSCIMADDSKPDGNYGDESCHTRVSDYIDWINENTKQE